MRNMWQWSAIIIVVLVVAFPEQASAQLFRRWADDNQRDSNMSQLPGMNNTATRVADYGANQVSEEIRNEVNGRMPVRPAPDFNSDAPLATIAKQYRNPNYSVQRPVSPGVGTRVQPPVTPHANRPMSQPQWIDPFETHLKPEDIAPMLEAETPLQDLESKIASLAENESPDTERMTWRQKEKAKPSDSTQQEEAAKSVADLEDDADELEDAKQADDAAEKSTDHTQQVRLPGLSFGTLFLSLKVLF